MNEYSELADNFVITMNLNTEMPLPTSRDTILSFFERIQKIFPQMRNFYNRDNGDYILEEDKDQESYRWVSLEPRRICSGYYNPPSPDLAFEQHRLILELVPFMLSVSQLDCEALDFLVRFDFDYQGNHDAVVAEALGSGPINDSMNEIPGSQILNFEPSITVSLEDDCRRQARLIVETSTNAYQVRKGEFPEEAISVYFTVRQYGSLTTDSTYEETLSFLRSDSERLLEKHIIDQVLRPLSETIKTK